MHETELSSSHSVLESKSSHESLNLAHESDSSTTTLDGTVMYFIVVNQGTAQIVKVTANLLKLSLKRYFVQVVFYRP